MICRYINISDPVDNPSKTSGQLDQDLIIKIQQGDKSAYDLLVIKYQSRIIQLVNRYVKDPSEAQDVAQETFIKAYRALAKFRGESTFYTWLYRIAINTAKNYLLSRARRYTYQQIDINHAEQLENNPQLQGLETPEHLLMNEDIILTIERVVDRLPKEMRMAISLREFEGMSYDDIAHTMGCPVGTIRSRIFRAREVIDRELAQLLEER